MNRKLRAWRSGLLHKPSSGCDQWRGRASDHPIRLTKATLTVERVEGENGVGDGGFGLCCNIEEIGDSLYGLVSFGFGVPEERKVASLTLESEKSGEREIVLH
jgi:hypothetical protein